MHGCSPCMVCARGRQSCSRRVGSIVTYCALLRMRVGYGSFSLRRGSAWVKASVDVRRKHGNRMRAHVVVTWRQCVTPLPRPEWTTRAPVGFLRMPSSSVATVSAGPMGPGSPPICHVSQHIRYSLSYTTLVEGSFVSCGMLVREGGLFARLSGCLPKSVRSLALSLYLVLFVGLFLCLSVCVNRASSRSWGLAFRITPSHACIDTSSSSLQTFREFSMAVDGDAGWRHQSLCRHFL